MRKFRRKKAWSWGITVVGLLTAYIAICPYICSAAQASEKAAHSCCPKSSQPDQQHNNEKSDSCCDQHEETLLNKSSESISKTTTVQPFILVTVISNYASVNNPASIFENGEGPPISMPDRPLYLVKNVFLI